MRNEAKSKDPENRSGSLVFDRLTGARGCFTGGVPFLFGTESDDGVFLGSASRREDTGKQGQCDAERDHDRRLPHGEGCYGIDTRKVPYHGVYDGADDIGDGDAEESGDQSYNKGLGIEQVRDVALTTAERADDADLFGTLYHGDVGDDADHDGRDEERERGEGDQRVGDDLDERIDHGDDKPDIVGIGDLLGGVFFQYGRRVCQFFADNVEF